MHKTVPLIFAGIVALIFASPGNSQDFFSKELEPRLFSLTGKDLALADVLEKLHQQTGNRVVDRRHNKTTGKLNLDLERVSFWPALEKIAAATGAGISLYETDSQIALVDRPRRPVPTCHSGLFRLAVKRLGVVRDEEADTHLCNLDLEMAWEPRFQPLLLEIAALTAQYAADAGGKVLKAKTTGGNLIAVAGRLALDLEEAARLQAPDRSSARITSLKGNLRVIAPAHMVTKELASLNKLQGKPFSFTENEVKITFQPLAQKVRYWGVTVQIDKLYDGPKFESFRAWWTTTTMHLEKGQGENKVLFAPRVGELKRSEKQAVLEFEFSARGRPPEGKPADWKLVFRTPGRIGEVTVPFEFKNLALP